MTRTAMSHVSSVKKRANRSPRNLKPNRPFSTSDINLYMMTDQSATDHSATEYSAIAVLGTFDSKGDEHRFIKNRIEHRGFSTLTIHAGTKGPSPFPADHDLYLDLSKTDSRVLEKRDRAIQAVQEAAKDRVRQLYNQGRIDGIISAGGGTGTHLSTSIMRELPFGVPKVMISTVAAKDMSKIVGTTDLTMIHSVADILGINSITGNVLDKGAGAICGMIANGWRPDRGKKRIALTMFGFITQAAENIKQLLEKKDYEVIAFHANGTGGMAMEELAAEGYFHGILDLATHELADELKNGYCSGIGPARLTSPQGRQIPRLVIPGGLDCAVLEFTRHHIPEKYRNRKIFFYDFRSAIRLDADESRTLARQLSEKLLPSPSGICILIPKKGWSEADQADGPLYDPEINAVFVQELEQKLNGAIDIQAVDHHINDVEFAKTAVLMMDDMLKRRP